MPLFPRKGGAHVGADDFAGNLDTDDAGAEAEHVHIVVLDSLVRRVGIVAQAGAGSADLIGGDTGADAAAADNDAALGLAGGYGSRNGECEVRIVVEGVISVRAEVADFVSVGGEELADFLLEFESAVVGADGEFHKRRF